MSILNDVTEDTTVAPEKDSVGGSSVLDSNIYPGEITLAYVIVSSGGAKGLVIQAKSPTGDVLKDTIYMTSGTKKGGKTYYEKDGKKYNLPGFSAAQALVKLTLNKPLSSLVPEDKVVKIYNHDAGTEVPTTVPMLMELIGQKVLIGVIKQTVDKKAKNAAGEYVETGETRAENVFDKFFHAESQLTTTEMDAAVTSPVFIQTWKDTWVGNVRDKTSKTSAGAAKPGAPRATPPTSTKPTESLFS